MQRPALHLVKALIGWFLLCSAGFAVSGSLVRLSAQNSPAEFSGMWKATVGNGGMMQGMWLAQVSKASPGTASGSWSLLSDGGEVVLQGTWSARKTPQNWEGTWKARAGNGQAFSGTWSAALGEFKGKTFQEMLALTMEKQIGGAWQSGRYQGNWWLEGSGKRRR
ncbi:MAG TPA: hypothetical protein VKB24_11500 [Candidatus Acidoferrum sp.]|nr:hypothetical protein [Candidatus Acidoferrum sp.]